MRKTSVSVFLLILVVLCFWSLFNYEPSRAQDVTTPPTDPTSPQEPGLKEIPKMIRNSKAAGVNFARRSLVRNANRLFQLGPNAVQNEQQLRTVINDGAVFDLDKPAIEKLISDKVKFLTLSLPDGKGGTVDLELVQVDILAKGFSVTTAAPTSEPAQEDFGVHYRGIVSGNEQSLAAISVFKNEMIGFFSTETDGNSVVGRLTGDNPSDTHIVYAEKDLKISAEMSCDTPESTAPVPDSLLQEPTGLPGSCIRIYVEADFDLYQNKGSSVTNTANYVIGLFNQSATLFANDGITVSLSEIFVWNIESPYAGLTTSGSLLSKFQQVRTSFNGDFGHLLALRGGGGVAAGFGTYCSSAASRECFSGIFATFSNVPTYSWSVNVFVHELGHLFGSRHTHACVWNGNATAIDGCGPAAGFAYEGSCSGAPIPSNGGTIMSYCHLSPNPGINFTLGFGTQPRNVIVNLINASTCLSSCGTITIGQGAPNPQLFIDAANRNNFLQFAKQPPTSVVHRWNCATCDPNNSTWGKGLIQDFDDITPGVHDALMLADTNTNFVAQIYGGMWDKFIQLGGPDYSSANTRMIGYPIADRNCSDFNATCFTDAQLVSPFGTSYHYQRFQGGAFVLHRSGSRNGQTFEVHGQIRARWQALNGPDGTYGLPISDEFSSNGKRQSDFEGGSICFNPVTNQTEDNCGTPPPANDNFVNAQVISNSSGFVNATNVGATKEVGEPNHVGNPGGKSVWYRWQAPNTGIATITTSGSNFDTLLAVYTGTSVGALTLIASNDDDPNGGLSSRVSFNATSGTIYRIAVDGFNGDSGNITLNWSQPINPPTAPVVQSPTNITSNSFTANWSSSSGATGYRLDVSTVNTFSSFVPGYQDLDVGNVTSRSVTGLNPSTNYFYRVRAYNGVGTSGNSSTAQATTSVSSVQVTVQTSPSGLSFTVDGSTFTTPQTFTWSSGSSHTISTSSPQNVSGGTRLAWANWSDGGAISHSVAPTTNTTYVANFNTQYFLTMNATPGGSVNPASNWFNIGQVVSISATPSGGSGFVGWNGSGSGSFSGFSNPVNVSMFGPITETANFAQNIALYDATLKAPKCLQGGSSCDSGALLNGRAVITAGPEANQPNTINNSCPDGPFGTYHQDESIDRIRVSTLDGTNLAPGKNVRIDVTAWVFSSQIDHLDLFYAADASNPNWIYIATIDPTVNGNQTLSTTLTLQNGSGPQAVRARLRDQGSVGTCTGPSSFDDHDDLIFTTGSSITNYALPANGGVASASSTLASNYLPSTAINGERAGANSSTGGVFNGWISNQTMPQWLQVDFGQTRSIQEIDVFMVQDNYQNPAPPTLQMTNSLFTLYGFDVQYWNGASWVTVPAGSVTGNNKVWRQFQFSPISTTKIRVLTNASPDNYSRLTEVEAWSDPTTPPPATINYALPANGGVASASTTLVSNYVPSTAINGERAGANSTTGGVFNGWISNQSMPQWLQVDFGQTRSLQEIDVFMVQDNYQNPAPPTLQMTNSIYTLIGFDVQYWNGASWVTVPGGSVTGNNKVWRQFQFSPISTTKIRVLTNTSPDNYSRLTELEAWNTPTTPPASINYALPANGGVASASSTLVSNYPPSNAINGERAGANSTTGGVFNGWISTQSMPQWLQVDFGQMRSINELDVFMVQDNYQNPATPTLQMTNSLYTLNAFELQYWNGASWVPLAGASNNNKVWVQFQFTPFSTTKIRVLTSASPDNYSRLTELEAWGPP